MVNGEKFPWREISPRMIACSYFIGPIIHKIIKKPPTGPCRLNYNPGHEICVPPYAMGFLFEKLEVYQRGLEFSETIETLCDDIKGNYHLTNQFRRAALSIPLNISEGSGRWHPKDKKQFYLIARGSAYECVPIIDLIKRRRLLDEAVYARLRNDLEAIAKMLTRLIQSTEG